VIPIKLKQVLEATGYFQDGKPAPGVRVENAARGGRRGRLFSPDALWRGAASLTVYFKYEQSPPPATEVASWRREIWNEGFAPLLWIVSPDQIDLYNGFARPLETDDAEENRLRTFLNIEKELAELDTLAGRFAMESGEFWLRTDAINRKTTVDQQLLLDLAALERDLVLGEIERGTAQGLIGRTIFTQYLIDRRIVDKARLKRCCGQQTLPAALRSVSSAHALFAWLRKTFNGDMFPASMPMTRLRQKHFARVADFLEATDLETGQQSLFPYQFDVIPVELISSIYEQFAHSSSDNDSRLGAAPRKSPNSAKKLGVHYTRLPVVSLVLDEVMNAISGNETVLDLTCGSGVFLVEALRRLVMQKSGGKPTRRIIRDTLNQQIFGVDVSEAAIRVAAFSLYLAALELDPDPQPPRALKFKELIGRTLIIGDAKDVESTSAGRALRANGSVRRFDLIVGNPPWTFKGKRGTAERHRHAEAGDFLQPRGEGLDFVLRSIDFSHEKTRYGIVLSAMPFFAASKTGAAAAKNVIQRLPPATLVNLAPLIRWLFPTAKMPAVVLLAGCRPQRKDRLTVVNVPWSPSGERSQTFEISPNDICSIALADWQRDPELLKAVAFGYSRDVALLNRIRSQYSTLDQWLTSIGSSWRDGLILGKEPQRTRSAAHLQGLELLGTKDLEHFSLPFRLETFDEPEAQWPRARDTYRSPLLLIKEFLKSGPRPVTAVSDRDLVYTDAYFGASLGTTDRENGHLLSAILSSSFAAWFFLMTASEFGVWKRRLLTSDVGLLPIPNLREAVDCSIGREILALENRVRGQAVPPEEWCELDRLVGELYGLDKVDRLLVQDGLRRAAWQWDEGRKEDAAPATVEKDLKPYTATFLAGIGTWMRASQARSMKAEIFDLPLLSPLRIVRFIVQDVPDGWNVEVFRPESELTNVIRQIGARLNVPVASSLTGTRELRIHARDEVIIIKPAARRFWMNASALRDVDAVVSESFAGTPT
jgi:hypothetical protein